jgi:hypothetical protein
MTASQHASDEPDVEFRRLRISDLDRVPVLSQSLDNQWVSPGLLEKMTRHGWSFDSPQVREARRAAARAEYIRALVNSPQLVVNRAYLYNNGEVAADFTEPGPARDAFRDLLAQGVIVPFLFDESSPVQRPTYKVNEPGWAAWTELARQCRMSCVRLSWDEGDHDRTNRAATGRVSRDFGRFVQSLNSFEMPALTRDLGLPDEAGDELWRQVVRLSDWGHETLSQRKRVTRDALYREFVSAGDPGEGRIDPDKPFAAQLKRLVDLAYNTNLADHLNTYSLAPTDGLRRTALQEWHSESAARRQEIDPVELARLVKRCAFDEINTLLYADSFADLELDEVRRLRGTDAWLRYASELRTLLDAPMERQLDMFTDPDSGLRSIVNRYVEIIEQASDIVYERRSTRHERRWSPKVELLADCAGATAEIMLFNGSPLLGVAGAVSTLFARKAAPFVLRLVLRNVDRRRSEQAEFDASVRLLDGNLAGGSEGWQTFLNELSTPTTERPVIGAQRSAGGLEKAVELT